MKIRLAKRSDKDIVLQFCKNTFSWGDYIDSVFDRWCSEPNGKLFVAVNDGANRNDDRYHSIYSKIDANTLITNTSNIARPIALCHAVLCQDNARLWIEGLRVDPSNRRQKVATALIDKMLQYGKSQGATEALAVISVSNKASRSLFYSKGFSIISKWGYYKIQMYKTHNPINEKVSRNHKKINKTVAISDNAAEVWNYLRHSKTYRLSGKKYYNEWRWYPLDFKKVVDFAVQRRLVIIKNKQSVTGVAIINTNGHGDSIFQIVYLDASSASTLRDLVTFCADMAIASIPHKESPSQRNKVQNLKLLEIISFQANNLSKIMSSLDIKVCAQFFLYSLPI